MGQAVLTQRVLNRTLLQRQHLLERVAMPALRMVDHLVGLQAQESLPPYLSLWSRLRGFDPLELSRALEERAAVRLLLMRGTVHLVSSPDALRLRPLMQPMLDKVSAQTQESREAAGVPREELAAAVSDVIAGGQVTIRTLGAALGERFPGYPPKALANRSRELVPLVQAPPRGQWKRAAGVSYAPLEDWVGAPMEAAPDMREVVRRYLRAFGPASAADVTAWCRVTGLRPVVDSLREELVVRETDAGKKLVDLEGLPLADPDTPAPVRLLGNYDNVWLSHAGRDRVTDLEKRRRWMGPNGSLASTVFVDGYLEGLWRAVDGRVEVQLFRDLTGAERAELDAEVAALEAFLAR